MFLSATQLNDDVCQVDLFSDQFHFLNLTPGLQKTCSAVKSPGSDRVLLKAGKQAAGRRQTGGAGAVLTWTDERELLSL